VAPELADFRDRLVDLGLPMHCFRHEAGDRPAVAGDDDGFAPLHLVEDLQQMRLRFRGLDFSYNQVSVQFGRFDWSK